MNKTKSDQKFSRRRFLKAAGASVPLLVAGQALGLDGSVSAMNRTTMGVVGIGCLGRSHLGNFAGNPSVEMLGVSDVDDWRLNNAMNIVRQSYVNRKIPKEGQSCKAYHDFLDLYDREDVDAVAIVMGDRWHSTAVKMAAMRGKDVFVEKPCALTVDECMNISQVVRENRRICQVGLQQRSDRYFDYVCELVRAGRLGRITHVYVVSGSWSREVDLPAEPVPATLDWERWLGPCPWREYNHRFHYLGFPKNVVPWEFCRDFGNAGIASGGVHAWDIVQWGLGMEYLPGPANTPGEMVVKGETKKIPTFNKPFEIIPRGCSDKYKFTTFVYPSGTVAQIVDGRIDKRVDRLVPGLEGQPVQSFGAIFVGEKGEWISVGRQNFLAASSPDLIKDGPVRQFSNHDYNFVDCVRSRREPTCPIERGCEATFCSSAGSLALWLNRPLKWDINKKTFINDEEANRYSARTPRGDWIV